MGFRRCTREDAQWVLHKYGIHKTTAQRKLKDWAVGRYLRKQRSLQTEARIEELDRQAKSEI